MEAPRPKRLCQNTLKHRLQSSWKQTFCDVPFSSSKKNGTDPNGSGNFVGRQPVNSNYQTIDDTTNPVYICDI